ncbi:ATP synthase F1 subunit epsilon [Helicobacter sp.]|uniref:ATP synthase F1 subunit epsilon n=1 Tax=Helicobacter sp. TaxID=218 RepID=UPI0019C48FDB|nr:ATP synthase F1 subunit epsilon [Helicobacter sp.]MBD5165064.1 F0F1 ATP synthase subunit epsilon [Helicobacter sp.]
METLKLDIVTPEGKIFSNDVKSVTLPGSEGEFGVLPGHIGIVTTLNAGVIEIEKKDNKKEIVAINWGYAKVNETSVDVLAEGAVDINGDSESEIAQAIANAKNLLEESTDNNLAVSMVVSRIENTAKSSL